MLRIGIDMDGVLADFAAAFRAVEVRLFGPAEHIDGGQPEKEEESQAEPNGKNTAKPTRIRVPAIERCRSLIEILDFMVLRAR